MARSVPLVGAPVAGDPTPIGPGPQSFGLNTALAAPTGYCCHCIPLKTAIPVIGVCMLVSCSYDANMALHSNAHIDNVVGAVLGILDLCTGATLLADCIRRGSQLMHLLVAIGIVDLFIVMPLSLDLDQRRSPELVERIVGSFYRVAANVYFATIVWSQHQALLQQPSEQQGTSVLDQEQELRNPQGSVVETLHQEQEPQGSAVEALRQEHELQNPQGSVAETAHQEQALRSPQGSVVEALHQEHEVSSPQGSEAA